MARIYHHLSPGRKAWMLRLRAEGPLRAPGTRVGYDCRVLGWTEWAWRTPNGLLVPASTAKRAVPADHPDGLHGGLTELGYRMDPYHREFLSEAGHRALEKRKL